MVNIIKIVFVLFAILILATSGFTLTTSFYAEAQSSDQLRKCYEKYEIWKLIGTNEFIKMFVNDPGVLKCTSFFESGLKSPQKTSGKYVNPEAGLQINIPSEWDSLEFHFDEITILVVRPEGQVYSAVDFDDIMMFVVVMDISTSTDIIQIISDDVLGNLFYDKSEPNTCRKTAEGNTVINQKDSKEIEFSCYNPTRELVVDLKTNTFRANEKTISFISAWFHDPSIESRIFNNWWERHPTIETKTTEIKKILSTLTIEKTSLVQKQPMKSQFPYWIENVAKRWSEGQIGDSYFAGGIKFMIKEKIINISDLSGQSLETAEQKIPDWVRSNAGWWADGLISDEDFVKGIQYLVENGMIRV